MMTVGLIEGMAERPRRSQGLFRVLSDHLRQRKGLAILGYSLAGLTKSLFPLANSAATVFSVRFLDRVGKSIRGAA
ncbi:MAG: hypothetical protein WBC62_07015 [Candidatus Macondimonas sp.]